MSELYNPEKVIAYKKPCSKCGAGGKVVSIRYFKKFWYKITESTKRIIDAKRSGWNCCWFCKKRTVVGETWGGTISHKKRNRLFCPECSDFIESKLTPPPDKGSAEGE
jgi:hypothetical protein